MSEELAVFLVLTGLVCTLCAAAVVVAEFIKSRNGGGGDEP